MFILFHQLTWKFCVCKHIEPGVRFRQNVVWKIIYHVTTSCFVIGEPSKLEKMAEGPLENSGLGFRDNFGRDIEFRDN